MTYGRGGMTVYPALRACGLGFSEMEMVVWLWVCVRE